MKNLLVTAILACTAGLSVAQDIHFSMYNQSPLNINPALTAADCDMRASVNYRSQWKGVSTPYKTIGASFEAALNKLGKDESDGLTAAPKQIIGAGLSILSDRAGDGKMGFTQANLTFASHVPLSERAKIGAAFMGGIGQKSIQFDQLTWDAQYSGTAYDPNLGSNESFGAENFTYQDLGAGIFFTLGNGAIYNRDGDKIKMNLGIAASHINRPKMSNYNGEGKQLDMKTTVHGGFLIPMGKSNFDLAPSAMYTTQGKTTELVAGLLLKANFDSFKPLAEKGGLGLSLGGHYRVNDSFIASVLIEFTTMAVGFSYDMGNSDIQSVAGNSNAFELSLRFLSPSPRKSAAPAATN